MSAPLVLFLVTGIFAVGAALLRGRPRPSAILAASGAAMLGLFALTAKLDEPFVFLGLSLKFGSTWSLLGRAFTLDEGNRAAVGFLFLAGAFIFAGAWAARPERYLFSFGILALGVVAGSLLIRPFLFAAVFLELAAMGSALILVSPGYPARRGGLRLLTLYTLAMLAILLAGWLLQSVGVAGGAPGESLRATLLLALGFAILMAVPPFHHWLPAAAEGAHPYALSFVAVLLQSAGLFFLLRFLDSYQWLRDNPDLFAGIRLAGTAMVCFGGVWALAQKSFSRVVAYALVTDFGVSLLAVGTQRAEGYELALGLVGSHAIGLAVCGLGGAMLRKSGGKDDVASLAGSGYRSPLAAGAALAGLLSLSGFPLAAGFPGRWALLAILSPLDRFAAAAVVLSCLAVSGAAARWLGTFIQPSTNEEKVEPTFGERLFLGGGVALCVLFGTFPQIFAVIFQVTRGLTNLVP